MSPRSLAEAGNFDMSVFIMRTIGIVAGILAGAAIWSVTIPIPF